MQPTETQPDHGGASWPFERIPRPPRVNPGFILLALAVETSATAFFQLLAFRDPGRWFPPMAWLGKATGGIIDGTLVACVTLQVLVIVGLLIGVGRFRPEQLGLDRRRLWPALKFLVPAWVVIQLLLLLLLPLFGQRISLGSHWAAGGWRAAVGEWLGQLLGNCPYEEVFFRGFLLPQCGLLVMRWMPKAGSRTLVAVALVLSQALFAGGHVFLNLHLPEGQWLLVWQFVIGVVFASVYLRTGNLFLAMGLHALLNNPAPLLEDPLPGPGAYGSIVLVGVGAWFISLAWAKRAASGATSGPT
jgi:membrane protease YdiL (CAAX protease family)